jgi:hypothetical protein
MKRKFERSSSEGEEVIRIGRAVRIPSSVGSIKCKGKLKDEEFETSLGIS